MNATDLFTYLVLKNLYAHDSMHAHTHYTSKTLTIAV